MQRAPTIMGWWRWFYIDQHPEIPRDVTRCQMICHDSSVDGQRRNWQCPGRWFRLWHGFRLCTVHAKYFQTHEEIAEGPAMNLGDVQKHDLVQQEKWRVEYEAERMREEKTR